MQLPQTDPIGYDDDFNLYVYVGNDPLNLGDPLGKCRIGATALSGYSRGMQTVIECSDGLNEVRTGGSRAWRNSNPGNIRGGNFSNRFGAVGKAGGFAIFPNEIIGKAALWGLLRSDAYDNLTPEQAIRRYAPPSENDTAWYQKMIKETLGNTGTQTMGDLSAGQMGAVVNTIGRVEGWGVGRVTYETRPDGSTTIKGNVEVTGTRIRKEIQCTVRDGKTTCSE